MSGIYSGGKQPAELVAKLRRAPEGRAGELECQARRAVVLSLVCALEPIVASIKQLERQIATAVREHPDGEIFRSLFKHPDSGVTAAIMVSEIGDCRARYPTRDALTGDAGQAAVALESGKHLARGPLTVEFSIHPDPRVVAEPDRDLLLDPRPPTAQARDLHQRGRPRSADAGLCRDLQPGRQTVKWTYTGKVLEA